MFIYLFILNRQHLMDTENMTLEYIYSRNRKKKEEAFLLTAVNEQT